MAARGVTPRRPVTLRDFLELGCDSSSDGFRAYPRCQPLVPDAVLQHLQQQQKQAPPAQQLLLRRSPSRSPSSSSSLFSSLPGPGALARISSLSRSFSRRIKEGFWRRRDEGDDEEYAYFDDRDSCGFPSPLVSSCSASDLDDSEADVVTTTTEETTPASERDGATASTSSSSSSSSSSSADHDRTDDAAAADGKKMQAVADGESAVGRKNSMVVGVEDKQQLSPVSVLDFPFDDDDGEEGSDAGTCSSPAFQFQRCTPPDFHRTKQQVQLLHTIGGYDGGGGVAQGIHPVDLDARFTAATSGSESGESADASTRLATTTTSSSTDSSSSSSAETTATRHDDDEAENQSADHSSLPDDHHQEKELDDDYRLLARLLEHDAAAVACLDDEVSRVLVLDFFAEGADRLIRSAGGRPLDDDPERSEAAAEALVVAAAEWLRGAGPRWGIGDVVLSGKAALGDMERSRRWMCAGEEERDVGADVEGAVVDALVDELVTELLAARRPSMNQDVLVNRLLMSRHKDFAGEVPVLGGSRP